LRSVFVLYEDGCRICGHVTSGESRALRTVARCGGHFHRPISVAKKPSAVMEMWKGKLSVQVFSEAECVSHARLCRCDGAVLGLLGPSAHGATGRSMGVTSQCERFHATEPVRPEKGEGGDIPTRYQFREWTPSRA
jgi:hypothetical protein